MPTSEQETRHSQRQHIDVSHDLHDQEGMRLKRMVAVPEGRCEGKRAKQERLDYSRFAEFAKHSVDRIESRIDLLSDLTSKW